MLINDLKNIVIPDPHDSWTISFLLPMNPMPTLLSCIWEIDIFASSLNWILAMNLQLLLHETRLKPVCVLIRYFFLSIFMNSMGLQSPFDSSSISEILNSVIIWLLHKNSQHIFFDFSFSKGFTLKQFPTFYLIISTYGYGLKVWGIQLSERLNHWNWVKVQTFEYPELYPNKLW